MKFSRTYSLIFIMGTLLLMTSCMDFSSSGSGSADLAPIIEKQELFEKKLNQINKKLDLISDALKKVSVPPAQANNKQKQNKRKPADPNYVHNIPQGDSYFMGNPNAKVTITEFYDFQ